MNNPIRPASFPRLAIFLALLLAACGQLTVAQADPNTLTPGGSILPVAVGPGVSGGATLVYSTNVAWANSSINGTLVSSIYSGDANNPYGGFTFTYELFLNASSINGVAQFTVSSFSDWTNIDVTYDGTTAGQAPFFASRSQASLDGGQDLNIGFYPEMSPGANTAIIDVDTGANIWFPGEASVIDHLTQPGVATLGPSAIVVIPVPEPSEFALMGAGGLFLLGYLRRWRNAGR